MRLGLRNRYGICLELGSLHIVFLGDGGFLNAESQSGREAEVLILIVIV